MIELPESIQPYVRAIIKYHFWLLAVLMPLTLVPLAFTSDAMLLRDIEKRKEEIESKKKAAEAINSRVVDGLEEFGHPKEDWIGQAEEATEKIRKAVLNQWRSFWDEQQSLREWPSELGEDFIRRVTRLQPDQPLSPNLLERYQNTIRRIVRKLPSRIDAAEEMNDTESNLTGRGRPSPRLSGGPTDEPKDSHTVIWDTADQSELFDSFNWEKVPSTLQIFLANEELHCYELICDIIRDANEEATGRHNATIAVIEQLAVGYRAAEENPGGLNGNRIQQSFVAGGDEFGGMGMDMGMGMDGMSEGGRPMNPRFSNSGSSGMMPGGLGGGFPGDPGFSEPGFEDEAENDELLKNWIYVDFAGKPLTAEELEGSLDAKIAHFVPFVLRGQVDQRKLDRLLQTFAKHTVPIDIRQVRINPGQTGELGSSDRGIPPRGGFREGQVTGEDIRRYDLDVEIRGTIALATKPDPALLGISESSDEFNE